MIALPTMSDVLLIHELTLEGYGGMRGITEQGFGRIESAVVAPDQSIFGEELYPDVPSKAGALFWGLVRAHGFSDGNKRVALVALLEMLQWNGYRLVADDEALYNFVMAAADSLGREETQHWIAARLAPM